MIEDAELLRRYAQEKSEEAFAELVRRRIDLVYSVARRQVGGDAQLAEDVTQKVFADLARKAPALAGRAVLSGWLYRSAQFAASDVVRSERRRRAREQETQLMQETSENAGAAMDWERVRPLLDEALGELGDAERDVVALRYFEGRPFAEVGRALQVTEEAARKRVERALDRLHGLLARRGVTSTTAALAVALGGQTGVAAPAGLAASVTGAALAGMSVGTGGWLTIFMGMTKLQIGVIGILATTIAATYIVKGNANVGLRREIDALAVQPNAVAALRAENQQLAGAVAKAEILRRDDVELRQLAQRITDMKKANEGEVLLVQAARTNSAWNSMARFVPMTSGTRRKSTA